jgi:HSP20 family protein
MRESTLSRPRSLLDDFFERGIGRSSELRVFSPRIDVAEREGEIKVTAELPGMEEKDIDITVDARGLTLRGEKKEEREETEESYYRLERSFGSFQRYIPFSTEIDRDNIEATFKKGLLRIRLPKATKELEQGKKIPIEP